MYIQRSSTSLSPNCHSPAPVEHEERSTQNPGPHRPISHAMPPYIYLSAQPTYAPLRSIWGALYRGGLHRGDRVGDCNTRVTFWRNEEGRGDQRWTLRRNWGIPWAWGVLGFGCLALGDVSNGYRGILELLTAIWKWELVTNFKDFDDVWRRTA